MKIRLKDDCLTMKEHFYQQKVTEFLLRWIFKWILDVDVPK